MQKITKISLAQFVDKKSCSTTLMNPSPHQSFASLRALLAILMSLQSSRRSIAHQVIHRLWLHSLKPPRPVSRSLLLLRSAPASMNKQTFAGLANLKMLVSTWSMASLALRLTRSSHLLFAKRRMASVVMFIWELVTTTLRLRDFMKILACSHLMQS